MQSMKSQRGQALIETALTIPIVMLMTLFVLDFGRGIYIPSSLNHISKNGADWAATDPRLNSLNGVTASDQSAAIADLTTKIENELSVYPGVGTGVTITICAPGINCAGAAFVDPIKVTLNRAMELYSSILIAPIFGLTSITFNITASSFAEKPNFAMRNIDAGG